MYSFACLLMCLHRAIVMSRAQSSHNFESSVTFVQVILESAHVPNFSRPQSDVSQVFPSPDDSTQQ